MVSTLSVNAKLRISKVITTSRNKTIVYLIGHKAIAYMQDHRIYRNVLTVELVAWFEPYGIVPGVPVLVFRDDSRVKKQFVGVRLCLTEHLQACSLLSRVI